MSDSIVKIIHALRKELGMTEEKLLGELHPLDQGQSWMGKGTYELYHAIGAFLKPQFVAEIGVRFGYSLSSICKGSGKVKIAYGFDNEYDLKGSLEIARIRMEGLAEEVYLHEINTQSVFEIIKIWESIDLAHIDGWHTEEGCYHDCCLMKPKMKEGGYILVDDVKSDLVKAGADRFCRDYGLEPHYIDCHTGMYLIEWRPR